MYLIYHLFAEIIRNYRNVNEVYHVIRNILDCDRGSTAISDTLGERIAERVSEDTAQGRRNLMKMVNIRRKVPDHLLLSSSLKLL